MKSLPVAVGIIRNQQKEVLIAQRPSHKPFGRLWEFPGGKIESSETALQALLRELFEELGIEVLSHHYLGCVEHDYGAQQVKLYVYLVDGYAGTPYCKELQADMCWVSPHRLDKYPLLDATRRVYNLLLKTPLCRPSLV